MRFWLANYHGGDGGGKNEENNKRKQEMEGGGGIEGSTRMPNLAYYYARDSVISAAFSLSVYLV